MITILHLIETGGPGGAENVLINISTGLDKNRFRSVVCLRKGGWLKDELSKKGINTFEIQEKWCFDARFAINLLRLVVSEKIDLIHSHEFLMSFYGTLIGRLTKCPVLTTFHGKQYYWEKRRRRIAMSFIARNSQLAAVSNDLRKFLSEKIGIESSRIKTVYNGIDLNIYCKGEKPLLIKKELGIDENTRIIGAVGNLYPVKGQIYLIRAIPLLLNENPNVMFLFIGRGNQENYLRQQAAKLNVSDQALFLGYRSDVARLLDIIDIWVLPSLSECLPLSLLEAMAKQVPSVVTDVGGNREIIDDGVSGFIVPPADVGALADKISLLLRDEAMREAMGRKALETVRQNFSLERMLGKYEGIYNSLLPVAK